MRVQQHIDDVGTAEVAGEVPSPVTWDLGQFTGLSPSPGPFAQTQRGYRDVGPPAPASALQLVCNGAGFYIDPRTFSHQLPLVLERGHCARSLHAGRRLPPFRIRPRAVGRRHHQDWRVANTLALTLIRLSLSIRRHTEN